MLFVPKIKETMDFFTKKRIKLVCIAVFLFFMVFSFGETVHELEKGETLYSLSKRYGVSLDEIIRVNKIKDPTKLRLGQKIIIPDSKEHNSGTVTTFEEYTVKKGDTLWGISFANGVTLQDFLNANNLKETDKIKPGEILLIPVERVTGTSQSGSGVAFEEDSALKEIFEGNTVPAQTDNGIIWPLKRPVVSYMTGKLYGVVLEGKKDEKVSCISSGTIISANYYRGYGNVLFVKASNGYIYVYGGIKSPSCKTGDKVSFGFNLGELTFDPKSNKSQLIFMVYKDGVPTDPAKVPRG